MNTFEFSIGGVSIDRTIIEALGWTLLHFLWQGSIVAAAVALLDILLPRTRPQLRYMAGCAALLVMLALPIATFVTKAGSSSAFKPAARPVAGEVWTRVTPPALTHPPSLEAGRPTHAPATRGNLSLRPRADLRTLVSPLATVLMPWFVAAWALGVGLLSLRLLGGWWLVMQIGRSSLNTPIDAWRDALADLARRMEVSRPVRLVRSSLVTVPTAMGWLRPVILLPASTLTGLNPTQLSAILAHELAHIRRHDYLVNLLQSVIETLLFYHPAVWWVSRRVREEREICCDDLAVRAAGDPLVYAEALCVLERLRGQGARMALAASGGSLVTRIARLLGATQHSHHETSRGLAWALIASLVLIGGAAGGAVRLNDRPLLSPKPSVSRPQRTHVRPRLQPRMVLATTPMALPLAAQPILMVAEAIAPSAPIDAVLACNTPKDEASVEATEALAPTPSAAPSRSLLPAVSMRFSAEEWEQLSQAGVSPRYVAVLGQSGLGSLSVDQLVRLAQHGISSEYATGMVRALDEGHVEELVRLASNGVSVEYAEAIRGGLGRATANELVQLSSNGVSGEYAAEMRQALGDPSANDLVRLASNGVSAEYASALRRGLGNPSAEDLVELHNHGVSAEFVKGMKELDLDDMTRDQLIQLANHGVTLEWFSALRWMGYSDLSVERAIELRNAGVTPDYAASLRLLNRHQITLQELRTLRDQGVDIEYAAALLGLLRKDLTVGQLIRMRQEGVTIQQVAAMSALGYSKMSADDLIKLRQAGVDPQFVAAMAAAGYQRLGVRDLVRLMQSGVTAEFIEMVREAGYELPEVSDLIKMREKGLP